MKIFLLFVLLFTSFGFSQSLPLDSAAVSVAEIDDAGAVLVNPAGLGVSRNFNSRVLFPINYSNSDSQTLQFIWMAQAKNSGFGYTYNPDGYDQLHLGSGQKMDYGIYFGYMSHISLRGYEAIDLGLLWRGYKWLSLGLSWQNVYSRDKLVQPLKMGIAVRPFGNRLTISYDRLFEIDQDDETRDLGGSIVLNSELISGIGILAGYNLDYSSTILGVSINYGIGGFENYSLFDNGGELEDNGIIGVSTNIDRKRSFFKSKDPKYVEIRFGVGIEDSPSPKVLFGDRLVTLREVIRLVDQIADDPDVAGVIVYPQQLSIGFAMGTELRAALVGLKAAGKSIYVFADVLTDRSYSLISMSDGIYLNSGGALMIDGIGMGAVFWKGTFDKLGLDAQYYRRGKYKSAAETYTREQMSEPSREARQAVLDDIDVIYREMMLDRPGIDDDQLEKVFDRAVFTASQALEYGLVDGVYHPDQKESIIKDLVGKDVKIVKTKQWARKWTYDWESGVRPQIALIYAEGPILPGKSTPSPFGRDKQIGSVTTATAIRKAREDELVQAIVLRVNSPGGSVLASEDIWREIHRTTHPDSSDEENRKPVFVSMGNVAASGGYYIACAADTIVADSACITGSIGVLAGKISLGGLYEKIGYNVDVLKAEPHSDMFSLHRSLTTEEGQSIQAVVDSYYEQFLERVAEGREMTVAEVDSVAQGRIWTGIEAQKLGLVDELGGLKKTIQLAKSRIGLKPDDDIYLKIYPGVERADFDFNLESGSIILEELDKLNGTNDIRQVLDRIALLNQEVALYLMEEIILEE